MIYSKRLQTHIPVTVESKRYNLGGFGIFTKYTVKDGKIPVGYVDIKDTQKGINVEFIKNQYPDLYSGFGTIADQIEVEHCLKRGIKDFEITSEGALNSHALHYLRGKRFLPPKINEIVDSVIKSTPKGEQYNTQFLGKVQMFMPNGMIQKYLEIIKKSPLI